MAREERKLPPKSAVHDLFGCWARNLKTICANQTQVKILEVRVRPELDRVTTLFLYEPRGIPTALTKLDYSVVKLLYAI
jgi:hypothetical protein